MGFRQILSARHTILGAIDPITDLVTNGLFSIDGDWSKVPLGNWTIAGGVATAAGNGSLIQLLNPVIGELYLLRMELISAPDDPDPTAEIQVSSFGGPPPTPVKHVFGASGKSFGAYQGFFRAWHTDTYLTIRLRAGGVVDNVSCHLVEELQVQAEHDDIVGLSLIVGAWDQYQ